MSKGYCSRTKPSFKPNHSVLPDPSALSLGLFDGGCSLQNPPRSNQKKLSLLWKNKVEFYQLFMWGKNEDCEQFMKFVETGFYEPKNRFSQTWSRIEELQTSGIDSNPLKNWSLSVSDVWQPLVSPDCFSEEEPMVGPNEAGKSKQNNISVK